MLSGGYLAFRGRAALFATTGLISTLVISSPHEAAAQVTQAAQTPSVEEIVVTGSRITTSGFEAPTPVTVVSAEQLTSSKPLISEGLNDLPSMTVGSQRTGGIGTGGSGQATINLRNIGAARALVILDGRRFIPSAAAGTVDTSQMPNILVQRVDVVTGGASAAYGSDAVAGVINYVLDKNFVGVKGQIEGGVSGQADVPEGQIAAAAGVSFGGDRGHFLLSGEGYKSNGISAGQRYFAYNEGLTLLTNPCPIGTAVSATCPAGSNNLPLNLRVSNAFIVTGSPGGLIVSGPLKGTTFDDGGIARQFSYGTMVGSGNMIGGEGIHSNLGPGISIVGSLDRANFFTHTSYDLTDNITPFAEVSWAMSNNTNNSGLPFALAGTAFKITPDNAFLPASVKALMAQNKLANVSVGKVFTDFPNRPPITRDSTWRVVAGVDFGIGTWKGEAYFEHGFNRRAQSQPNQLDQINTYAAVDAVVVPANTPGLTAGNIVCRSTLTNPTNGCIPLNIFGPNSASQAAISWLTAKYPQNWLDYIQDVGSVSISGSLFEGWAGPISAAAGGEVRKESLVQISDPYSQVANPVTGGFGGYLAGSALPYSGDESVKEAFAEADAPLAKGINLLQQLSLNGAIRVTDYSTSGTVTTWKVGALYNPIDDLRLRFTQSRDIRAPNLSQLYQAGSSGTGNFTDPANGNKTVAGVKTITTGNPLLVPEVAKTQVFGAVYSPHWFDGVSISVDHYSIKIANAITTIPNQTIINGCYGFGIPTNTSYCPLIIRDGSGNLTALKASPVNAQILQTTGWDIEGSLKEPIPSFVPGFGDGDFTFRSLATRVNSLITAVPGGNSVDASGENSGVNANDAPRWRVLTSASVAKDGVTALLQMRFFSAGIYDVTKVEGGSGANGINNNRIPSVAYLDTRLSYKFETFGGNWEAYVSVNNLLDKDPPPIETNGSANGFTNLSLYDAVGRYFRVGITVKY